jgi:esterase/lipase
MTTDLAYVASERHTTFLEAMQGFATNTGSTISNGYLVNTSLWRPGNGTFAMIGEEKNRPCVVLIHGLSVSPYYLRDLSVDIYKAGHDVVAPLLPGMGLIHPNESFKKHDLHKNWISHVDEVVSLVREKLIPSKIIIGGLSLGGLLALNHVLESKVLDSDVGAFAGLLLLAPALNLYKYEVLCRLPWAQAIAEYIDGEYTAGDQYTHSYETNSLAGAVQVTRLNDLIKRKGRLLKMPVLAIAGLTDPVTDPMVTMAWLRDNCTNGQFVGIASPGLSHSRLAVNDDADGGHIYKNLKDTVINFARACEPRLDPVMKFDLQD